MIRLLFILSVFYYLVSFMSYIYNSFFTSDLLIYFLDVGQGDSIVIVSNSETLVIDGGPSYDSSSFIYNLSSFNSCNSVSLLLTHPHYDHLAGLNRILAFCNPAVVYTTSVSYKSKTFEQFQALTENLNVKYLQKGDEFRVGDAQFYVLWPSLNQLQTKSRNTNNYSIVLFLDYGEYEAIFTGDAELGALAKIEIEKYDHLIEGAFELFKVSHHGSVNGLSRELLEYLEPKTAVISVGKNSYGHPSQEVLDFFSDLGTKVLRTDLEGAIRIKVKKNDVSM